MMEVQQHWTKMTLTKRRNKPWWQTVWLWKTDNAES